VHDSIVGVVHDSIVGIAHGPIVGVMHDSIVGIAHGPIVGVVHHSIVGIAHGPIFARARTGGLPEDGRSDRARGRAGWNVLEVSNDGEARAFVQTTTRPADALVTDIVLPGLSGIELAERVLEGHPGMRAEPLPGDAAETLVLVRPGCQPTGSSSGTTTGRRRSRAAARAGG
jgi:hypothetical protein